MQQFEIHDEVWASDIQANVQQYTDSLYEQFFDEEDDVETLSGTPFDGCEVCFWRETLTMLVPVIIQGYLDGKVTLVEDGGSEAKSEA